MLTFNHKYEFPATRLAEITAVTCGATVHSDGTFEAASDDRLPGRRVPVSHDLVIRVTGSKAQRIKWAAAIRKELQGSVLDTSERGYWQPTDEWEASWKITAPGYDHPTRRLLARIYDWLVEANQQAVYMEYGGVVYILDRDEVLALMHGSLVAA